MKRWLSVGSLVVLALLALAASPWRAAPPSPEALLRRGNAAFARGEYAEAAALYEQAEARATDPGLVAFNLAAAKYHLALSGEGAPQLLLDAERLYRCCLGRDDPRRPRALYGLGNCALQRANSPEELRQALQWYAQALREVGPELREDVLYNRERARLLLAQSLGASPPEDGGPDKDNNPPQPDKQTPEPQPSGADGTDGTPDESSASTPAEQGPGDRLTQTNAPPAPGAGNLQPVPDRADPLLISPDDAAQHLDRAARLIVEERQAYRKGQAGRPAGVARDW